MWVQQICLIQIFETHPPPLWPVFLLKNWFSFTYVLVFYRMVRPGGLLVVTEPGNALGSHTVRSVRKMLLEANGAPVFFFYYSIIVFLCTHMRAG